MEGGEKTKKKYFFLMECCGLNIFIIHLYSFLIEKRGERRWKKESTTPYPQNERKGKFNKNNFMFWLVAEAGRNSNFRKIFGFRVPTFEPVPISGSSDFRHL